MRRDWGNWGNLFAEVTVEMADQRRPSSAKEDVCALNNIYNPLSSALGYENGFGVSGNNNISIRKPDQES